VAPARIVPVIAGKEPLTSDLMLQLAHFFRTSPQFWLGLQTAYDLFVAQAQHGPRSRHVSSHRGVIRWLSYSALLGVIWVFAVRQRSCPVSRAMRLRFPAISDG
jgi:hypothetical protein